MFPICRWVGDPRIPSRMWAKIKVDPIFQCWIWIAKKVRAGYGVTGIGSRTDGSRRSVYTHRFFYEMLVAKIPEGLQIDHLCRVRACCNPNHLEPVTARENLLRGETLPAMCSKKTHCPLGHPYDEDNTIIKRGKHRNCRTCENRRVREWRARQAR
jgi:HNH endonuclease